MTSKERMRLVMKGEKPERVPVMCQLSLGHIYRNMDMGPVEYWYTPEGLVDAYIEMAKRYSFDGILVSISGRDPEVQNRVKKIDQCQGGHLLTWDDGRLSIVPPDDFPYDADRDETRIKTKSINEIEIDSIEYIKSEADMPEYAFNILDRILCEKGGELSIHGEVSTVFESFLVLMGTYECGLMSLVDDPCKCYSIMEKMNNTVIAKALAQCRRNIDALKMSSPFAGAGFISRTMYEEFILPFEKEVVNKVKSEFDIPCYIHTCGAIGDRLDLLAETGVDGIECLDPFPLGNVDLGKAVEEIGGKVFIKGNLDSVNELQYHTPGEIMQIACERIKTGMKCKKGFVLSSACSISPGVPSENVTVLYQAVERYGRYQQNVCLTGGV